MKCSLFNYHDVECIVSKNKINTVVEIINKIHTVIEPKSASTFRKAIVDALYEDGWDKNAGLSFNSKINITAFSDGIGLCCQTGNVSRIYADMLKLQTLWVANTITAGIIIVPVSSNSKILGDNMATYERLIRELTIFERVITMPLLIIGIDGLEE